MSFEDIDVQPESLFIPLPPKRWCSYPGCRTPLAQSNRETMCYRHQQEQHRKKVMGVGASSQTNGLGAGLYREMKPRRPGRKPKIALPPPIPAAEIQYIPAPVAPDPVMEEVAVIDVSRLSFRADCNVEPVIEPEVQPVEEIKEEEVTLMTKQTEEAERPICAVMGCDKVVSQHNKTGRCSGHYYLKRGMQMKDGSIPNPHTKLSKQMVEARKKNAAKGTTGLKRHTTLPAPTVLITKDELDAGMVSLKVPAAALDRFFMNLSLEDKTRIIERELLGA